MYIRETLNLGQPCYTIRFPN